MPDFNLIAIDLDGTLLDSRGGLPARNRAALHLAHEAGVKIVVCTGRTFTETRGVLDKIGLDLDATITVGGALLSEARTGDTIERFPIAPDATRDALAWLRARDYAVIWTHDAREFGFDGYVIDGPRRHASIARWLEWTACDMRTPENGPPEGPLPLRLTIVDSPKELPAVTREFREAFAGRLNCNFIHVISSGFTFLEVFDAGVDKWIGVRRLCKRWNIDPSRTAAIGDDVNDLPMLTKAGRGVAVANATPTVRAAVKESTATNDECGVAQFIERALQLDIPLPSSER